MSIDEDEIAEEIAHHTEMLRVLRRRLRERELQEAKFGINVPPEITSDVQDLIERVQRHDAELVRLRTVAAQDNETLAEAEYRVLLCDAWDTPQGWPTTGNAARLALARLRLGVSTERASELEREVRVMLTEETWSAMSLEGLIMLFYNDAINPADLQDNLRIGRFYGWKEGEQEHEKETDNRLGEAVINTLQQIIRAIRLDYEAFSRLLAPNIHTKNSRSINNVVFLLSERLWLTDRDKLLLFSFENSLKEAMREYR